MDSSECCLRPISDSPIGIEVYYHEWEKPFVEDDLVKERCSACGQIRISARLEKENANSRK